MRKFLKVCHIISRVFIFLCIAAAMVLLFFRPEGLGFGPVPATTDGSFWKVFATTLGLAAVMFAASDWAYRLLEDNDFLHLMSSSILKPAFERHDLSDRRFQRSSADELDFNASLRTIADGKERVLQELAWEKKNNKALQKKTVGHGIISLVFFVLALLFLIYPIVMYFVQGKVLALPGADLQAYFAVAAVVLTFIIIFDYTGYQKAIRRLNTVLSIRERCDAIYEQERGEQPEHPKPFAALAEAVTSAVRPEAPATQEAESETNREEAPVPEKKKLFGHKKPASAAPIILPEEVPAETPTQEPASTDALPAAGEQPAAEREPDPFVAPQEAKDSPFESLVPEEETAEN